MSLFYRKPKVADKYFSEDRLPANRFYQFLDISKNRFTIMLMLGLWFLLFFIPLFALILLRDSMISSIYAECDPGSNEFTARELQAEMLYSFLRVIGLMIFFIGLCMELKIIKRLIFCEPIFWKEDFAEGIKENWKYFLLVSFTIGLMGVLRAYLTFLLGRGIVYYAVSAVDFVILIPYLLTFVMLSYIYNESVFLRMAHSFNIFIKSFIFVLPLSALLFATKFLRCITTLPLLKYAIILILVAFVLPFYCLGFFELEFWFFDKYINKTNFPSIYRIGLKKQK